MTYGELMDKAVNEPRPTEGINKGDSTMFAFQNRLITVVVYSVGWDTVNAKSADLKWDFPNIPAKNWKVQKALIDSQVGIAQVL